MTTNDRVDVEVAVIGAGIGGLTLGLALRRHGIEAHVFERAGEISEVGAAVALAANGTRILTDLGLHADLAPTCHVPDQLVYRRWSDGSVLATHPIGDRYADRFGGPFWGVHRADLQRTLVNAWGTHDLYLDRELVDLRSDGDATVLGFADGSTVRARVVVGADGVHSRVRRHITDVAPVYSGTSGFRGLVPRAVMPDMPDPGALQFWMGPGGHLLHYAIGDVVNFLAVIEGPPTWNAPTGRIEAEPGTLAAAFADWAPAVRQMIDAVPQGPRWGLFALPPLMSWSRDGVVLLGDAAHAMLPHHGQGANQTIEDAAVLADCLATQADPAAAFAVYQRRRRARTRQVQRSSWVTSALLHLPDGDAAAARDAALRDLDVSWIHAYDPRTLTEGTSV